MKPLRLALALVILTLLPAFAADQPAPSRADALRQWMTEHHFTRAIGISSPSFWGTTVLYLGETQPHSATVRFYLHENYRDSKPTTLRGTITRGPQIERLFSSQVYTISKEIKGIPDGDTRVTADDAASYYFAKIENGRTRSSLRNGADTLYFEPIVRQQADAVSQGIKAIHEAKKKS